MQIELIRRRSLAFELQEAIVDSNLHFIGEISFWMRLENSIDLHGN